MHIQIHSFSHTFLSLTGGGIIVGALNLLLLQVSLKPGEVCVQTPDVLVDLQKSFIKTLFACQVYTQ